MAAAWNDLPATGGLHECAALVSSAEALRVSAPELSVQLARRALLVGATDASAGTTNAGEARNLSMRAQALLASGLVRMSQHAKAVEPGFAALALAESGGAPDLAAVVRIDLAACAQQVGEPLLGGALLRPVLESMHTPPSVRATALGRLVGCVGHVARRDDVEDALAEADRLLAADNGISPEVRRMERARLAVRSAGYHRWYGDTEDAITAAREGLNLLTRLRADLRSESDRLRARLSLELVCGLLDEGELREAEAAARPTVDEPVRATSAASVGRLMLALATRVYLPGGQTDRGRHLLDQAAWTAERHALDGLRADALTELSRLDEQAGRAAEALEALRSARAAEHRRMRAVSRAARIVLVEVGAGHGIRDTAQQSVAALMRQLAHPTGLPVAVAPPPQVGPPPSKPDPQPVPAAAAELAGTVDMDDEGTRLLDREALFRRLRSVRKGERPVALTLVRFEQNRDDDRGPDTGIMAGLADKVRDMAPDNAELARSDGSELAVILPATTRDQAEEFAANIRETAIESGWTGAGGKDMSISTGVVQSDQTTTDAADMLTAARDALTPAQTAPPAHTAASRQTANAELAAGAAQTASTTQAATSTHAATPTQAATSAHAATPAQAATRAQVASTEQAAGAAQTASAAQMAGAAQAATSARMAGTEQTGAAQTGAAQTTSANSLAETSAALNSALSEDTPTKPLNARPTEQAGRSILSSLAIPSGSGGRRRAGEEQPPGAKSRWPAEPAEAPRWTRAERRAQQESSWPTDPTPTPPGGWPTPSEEPSQGKRAATPDKPSFSETVALTRPPLPTRHGKTTAETDETTRRDLPTPTHGEGPPAPTPSTDGTPNRDSSSAPAAEVERQATPSGDGARPTTTPEPAASHATGTSVDDVRRAAAALASSLGDTPVGRSARMDDAASHASPSEGARPVSSDDAASGERVEVGLSAQRVVPAAGSADVSGSVKADEVTAPAHESHAAGAESAASNGSPAWGADSGIAAGLAGLSSGGTLRGAEDTTPQRSSYEETKAELARMMSALNAKSLAAREGKSNGARQSIPTPPDDVPEPAALPDVPEPDPIPAPPEPTPEPGQRSGLMAAFDALTGPLPGLRAEFDSATELPARKPAESWAELETSNAVESPADELFGTEVKAKPKFRSSLGAAFAEFGATEKKVTEPVKETVQETVYDEPIGPQPRPDDLPRRGEKSSATIASLLTEALAAYQSTAEDAEEHRAPERFDSFVADDADRQQSGVTGRHRSPE